MYKTQRKSPIECSSKEKRMKYNSNEKDKDEENEKDDLSWLKKLVKKSKSDSNIKSKSNKGSLLSELLNKSKELDRIRLLMSMEDEYKKRVEKRERKKYEEKYELYNRRINKYERSEKLYFLILLYD